ncbi:MAG: SH3 domain-containing protein [Firmicutes bacterium]|nr:SH3 domain-containing protein [Bacillota bacterium]
MDYKVTNTQDYLPILQNPQVGAAELGKVHNGDTVTLIKEHDAQFWYVKVPSLGIEGYVAKDYLTK